MNKLSREKLRLCLPKLTSMRHMSDAEVKWLKNRTNDPRQEVRKLARAIYAKRFPHAARNKRKQERSIRTLELTVDGEVYDGLTQKCTRQG